MTLDEIYSNAGIFPTSFLRDTQSAACFFAAGFLGRNDVVHLTKAKVENVLLVDKDEAKLQEMEALYPETWSYEIADAYDRARNLKKEGRTFDVVIIDPWTGDIGAALHELPLWRSLATKCLVIGVCRDWFASKHLENDSLTAFNDWVKDYHWNGEPSPPPAAHLIKRSNFRGGVYWAVFDLR